MLSVANSLLRYALFFATRNTNPLIQIELGGHIVHAVDSAVIHGFVNAVAGMISPKRKKRYPHLNDRDDWVKSEQIYHKEHVLTDSRLYSIKCVAIGGHVECHTKGYSGFPSIEEAVQRLSACGLDQDILEVLEELDADKCDLLFREACGLCLDDRTVGRYLAREIAQFFFEREGEILQRFDLSC